MVLLFKAASFFTIVKESIMIVDTIYQCAFWSPVIGLLYWVYTEYAFYKRSFVVFCSQGLRPMIKDFKQ